MAVLIEHQSTPDKSMAVRVHHYMMSIFTKELQQQSKHKKLTPVYPVIFYNGIKSPYPYSLDIFENFDDPLNIMPDVLAKPIPLIDINLLDDDKLRKQNLLGIVTRAIKYRDEMQWTKQSLIELVDDLILILSHTKPNEFREIFRPLVTYLTNIVGEQKLAQAIVENEKLPKNVKGEFMTAYEFYLQKGKNIGIEQGKNIGIEQGKNIGIEQGEAIGFEKGEYQKSIEIAKTALRKDFDIQTVAELTELDVKTIQMLVEQLKDEK